MGAHLRLMEACCLIRCPIGLGHGELRSYFHGAMEWGHFGRTDMNPLLSSLQLVRARPVLLPHQTGRGLFPGVFHSSFFAFHGGWQ